ncbi:MAG: NAD(P)-dependent alcohol dehydrogenase [Planctomycetota bacterium]
MRAFLYEQYGGPEVLFVRERPVPEPKPAQVRVRVHAASINAADYRMMRADPFLVRLANGLFRPKKYPVLGIDLAGVVEAVGAGVTQWKVGDAVFGECVEDGMGSFAESVCVRADRIAALPDGTSFAEAAAIPLAGITALQGVRDLGEVGTGAKVLVQGAGGGVGHFAVQIAKACGAHVVAVCGAGSADLARACGADEVLDYRTTDFAARDERYDVIFGINGHRSVGTYHRCLAPGGRYVMIGGSNGQIFAAMLWAPLRFRFSDKTCRILHIDGAKRGEDLQQLRRMWIEGTLRPSIDRTYEFNELRDAMRYVEQGHVRGKVVLRYPRARSSPSSTSSSPNANSSA